MKEYQVTLTYSAKFTAKSKERAVYLLRMMILGGLDEKPTSTTVEETITQTK